MSDKITEEELAGDAGFSVFDLNLVGSECDIPNPDGPSPSPYTDEAVEPLEPTIDTREHEFADRFVNYAHTSRQPGDCVLSGPIIGGWGPGRYFQNRHRAFRHLAMKYGHARVKKMENQTKGRWAFLVKGLRSA